MNKTISLLIMMIIGCMGLWNGYWFGRIQERNEWRDRLIVAGKAEYYLDDNYCRQFRLLP